MKPSGSTVSAGAGVKRQSGAATKRGSERSGSRYMGNVLRRREVSGSKCGRIVAREAGNGHPWQPFRGLRATSGRIPGRRLSFFEKSLDDLEDSGEASPYTSLIDGDPAPGGEAG